MMCDAMRFPDTVDEFMESYKIVDSEQVYTNGAELIPIFRMKQWLDHVQPVQERKNGRWLNHLGLPLNDFCSVCAKDSPYNKHWKYCPNCGAHMEGAEDAEKES